MTCSRFLNPSARLVSLALLGLAMLPHTVHAQTFISNDLGQSSATNGSGTNLNDTQTKAYGFTTSATAGFTFTSVTIALSRNSGSANTISGGLYANNAGNPSSTQLVAFDEVSVTTSAVNYRTLTPLSSFQLSPGTTYWVRFFSTTAGAGTQWDAVPSTQPTASGEASSQVTPIGYRNSNNSGGTWGTSGLTNSVTITLATVPEPGTLALLALGIVGGVVARRRK
jgi:PEP-CTERM motif